MSSLSTFLKQATQEDIKTYQTNHTKLTISQIEQSNNKKMELINEQIKNYGMYIHSGLNSKFKNSFYLPNILSYNDIIIDSIESFKNTFTLNNMLKYNYSEHLYLNESRIFYDIDFKEDTPENQKEFEKIIKSINWIATEFNLKVYGLFEVNNEEYIDIIPSYFENILIYVNENQTKIISGHIFLNGYTNRKDIELFMKNYIFNKFEFDNKIGMFDTSVYKTTKQAFRCGWSAKVDEKNKTIREIPKSNIEDMVEHYDILYNLRFSPLKEDKHIDLSKYIENQNKQKLNVQTKLNSGAINQEDKNISIFQYIKYNNEIINIKDIYLYTNHFDFSKIILPFCQSVLTPEETIEEIRNIYLPEEIPIGFRSNDEWLEDVINDNKTKIKQDISNIKSLYVLKKYVSKYYEQEANKLKEDKDAIKQLYNELRPVLSNIEYYIQKYEKLNFVSRDYYDFYESKESKGDKLLYNCYKNYYGQIFNAFDDSVNNNLTQFRLKYRLDQNTANKIYEQLTAFEGIQEYKKLRTEYIIKSMSKNEIQAYKSTLTKFLKIFKTSFKHTDDYDFYLSYYSAKLQNVKSLNKGIINQGTEKDPAINSFKTFFNELLDNYLSIKSANVNNINKTLNGTYFTGNLLVIEELPKKIKDIDNLINTFREYSSKKTLTIEEKGEKPKEILNRCDYIINTNHTVKDMFKDFNDAKGLLKRFRIITRQTVEMTPEVNEIIDEIVEHNDIYQYLLKDYLINEIKKDNFIKHKNEYNDIMTLYLNSSSTKTTMNKKSTNVSIDEFVEDFKQNYIDNKKRLKLNKFRQKLIDDRVISLEHAKTLKQNLIILLSEDKTVDSKNPELIKVDNKQITIVSDDAIKTIYDTYYEYDDEQIEE